jgi:hypothetical protein
MASLSKFAAQTVLIDRRRAVTLPNTGVSTCRLSPNRAGHGKYSSGGTSFRQKACRTRSATSISGSAGLPACGLIVIFASSAFLAMSQYGRERLSSTTSSMAHQIVQVGAAICGIGRFSRAFLPGSGQAVTCASEGSSIRVRSTLALIQDRGPQFREVEETERSLTIEVEHPQVIAFTQIA